MTILQQCAKLHTFFVRCVTKKQAFSESPLTEQINQEGFWYTFRNENIYRIIWFLHYIHCRICDVPIRLPALGGERAEEFEGGPEEGLGRIQCQRIHPSKEPFCLDELIYVVWRSVVIMGVLQHPPGKRESSFLEAIVLQWSNKRQWLYMVDAVRIKTVKLRPSLTAASHFTFFFKKKNTHPCYITK